jgi:basic amino acid/polyamine antiporter, APA family
MKQLLLIFNHPMKTDPNLFEEKTELERKLGFTDTLSIVVNRIIGSGIFRTPAPIMFIAGSVSMFYGVWILGGLATMLSALCYAELVASMPRAGGPYVFLKAAYPPVVTFLRGWAMFFVSETGAIAAVALFFAENFLSLMPVQISRINVAIAAISIVFLLTAANSAGLKLSSMLQNVFSVAKVLVLVLILVFSFSSGWHADHFIQGQEISSGGWSGLLAVMTAMRYGFFAYSGWEGATYVAEEVKNPRKNLPLSLFIGIGLVMFLYLMVNTAYLNLLSPAEIAGAKVVAIDAMKIALGPIAAIFVAIAIMVSTFGNVNTQIMVKSRTWYAMARDKLFFNKLASLHPRYKTPNYSLYAQALWASLLIIFASFAQNAYEGVIDFFSFTSSVFNVLTFVAVFLLRKKYPQVARPYKVWAYPLPLIIVLLIQFTFMAVTLVTAFYSSLFGILLTATGLIYYKWFVPEEAKQTTV